MHSSIEVENKIQAKVELALQEQISDSTWSDDSTNEMTAMNERGSEENGTQVKEEQALQEQVSDSTWTDDSTNELITMNGRVPSYLQYDDETLESFSFETISVQSIYGESISERRMFMPDMKPRVLRRNKLRQIQKIASTGKVIVSKTGNATKQAYRSTLFNSKLASRKALKGTRNVSTLVLKKTRLVSRKIAQTTKSTFVRTKQASGKIIARTRDTSQATLFKTRQISRKAMTGTCKVTKSTVSNAKEASCKALAGSRHASNMALTKTKNVSTKALKRTQNAIRLVLQNMKQASKLAVNYTREVTRSVIFEARRVSREATQHSRNTIKLALVRTRKISQNVLLRFRISSRLAFIKAKVRSRTILNRTFDVSKRALSPICGKLKKTCSSVGRTSKIMMARTLIGGDTIFRNAIATSRPLLLKLTLLSLKTKLVIENKRNEGRLVNNRYFTSEQGLIVEVDDEKECLDQFVDTQSNGMLPLRKDRDGNNSRSPKKQPGGQKYL